jgi:hypothetical protein
MATSCFSTTVPRTRGTETSTTVVLALGLTSLPCQGRVLYGLPHGGRSEPFDAAEEARTAMLNRWQRSFIARDRPTVLLALEARAEGRDEC